MSNVAHKRYRKLYKDFKVAHIVPVSCLSTIASNHYHMCLAHLVAQNDEYAQFYRDMSDSGKFVLMDNGAAENSQLEVGELLGLYERIRPTEIVVPDTLCDSKSTLEKADQFISQHGDLPYRFMAVPQGKTYEEWCACATTMLERYKRINTIGVSKFLNIATDDPYIRFAASRHVEAEAERLGMDVDIHLLGCDEGPSIVNDIQMEVPSVRGCDSAFAYIATQAGIVISSSTQRPEGEIDFIGGDYKLGLIENMVRFNGAAGAMSNMDATWPVSNRR